MMPMSTHLFRYFRPAFRRLVLSILVVAAVAGCHSKPAATPVSENAWAVVNAHEITAADVDKAWRRSEQSGQPLGEDERFAGKVALLDQLIAQELFLAKAASLKIDVPPADLDAAFAEARKGIPEEAFKQELARRNLTEADMREGLRREMLVQKLFEREVASKVAVADEEIAAFYDANKAQFNRTEEAYRVAQIVVTPVRENQIANRTGSDATTALESVQKYRMIMEKLKGGAQFGEVAADFSEDPQSAPRGGDLGFIPLSVVQKYPPRLRDAVLKAKPGAAQAIGDGTGFVIVLVLGTDPAGQKTLDTPGVKDAIRESLKSRREGLLRAAYVDSLRNGAAVENVIARRVVEAQGKVPAVARAASR